VRVLPIADGQMDAARAVHDTLRQPGFGSHLDERSETLSLQDPGRGDAQVRTWRWWAAGGEAKSVAVPRQRRREQASRHAD